MDVLTMQETVDLISNRVNKGIFTQHVVINVAKIVNLKSDKVLQKSINSCDIINIDGMGVVIGARFLGYDIAERVAGIDLFYNLMQMSAVNNFPVFLLGATSEVVNVASGKIKNLYPSINIAGFHHGYFWEDELTVVRKIKDSGAKLLFVAITSPKKENFINKWKDQLGVDFVMGVGGTFDVVSGKIKRAPIWMQDYGLEWLYRVIQEPKRMWKRYLVTNSRFFWIIVKEKWLK
jgi:N-acetylglucosaminyldiphosphoundecaprenol N-acetyl-beta-D-mannosaminyltransferase